jgi:hypothetical protein
MGFDAGELGTLESCAFCGDLRVAMKVDREGRLYRIVCRSCRASGPVSLNPQGAVGLWNMRRVEGAERGEAAEAGDVISRAAPPEHATARPLLE